MNLVRMSTEPTSARCRRGARRPRRSRIGGPSVATVTGEMRTAQRPDCDGASLVGREVDTEGEQAVGFRWFGRREADAEQRDPDEHQDAGDDRRPESAPGESCSSAPTTTSEEPPTTPMGRSRGSARKVEVGSVSATCPTSSERAILSLLIPRNIYSPGQLLSLDPGKAKRLSKNWVCSRIGRDLHIRSDSPVGRSGRLRLGRVRDDEKGLCRSATRALPCTSSNDWVIESRRSTASSRWGSTPDPDRLPPSVADADLPRWSFNRRIIDATHEHAACYKPNAAFYEDADGWRSCERLSRTRTGRTFPCCSTPSAATSGNTARQYAEILDVADAITVNPYMGQDSLAPLLQRTDKGVFVPVGPRTPAGRTCRTWNSPTAGRCTSAWRGWPPAGTSTATSALVVGATNPDELEEIREIVPDVPFVPGVGAQGGDAEAAVEFGLLPTASAWSTPPGVSSSPAKMKRSRRRATGGGVLLARRVARRSDSRSDSTSFGNRTLRREKPTVDQNS